MWQYFILNELNIDTETFWKFSNVLNLKIKDVGTAIMENMELSLPWKCLQFSVLKLVLNFFEAFLWKFRILINFHKAWDFMYKNFYFILHVVEFGFEIYSDPKFLFLLFGLKGSLSLVIDTSNIQSKQDYERCGVGH